VSTKISRIGDGFGAIIGISTCGTHIARALQEADEAMYETRKNGKNGFSLYRMEPTLVSVA